jgi:hypothetical protein
MLTRILMTNRDSAQHGIAVNGNKTAIIAALITLNTW